MKQPLVSVIVPCKNSSQFIGECLKSIKSQTYKNIQIIVVDNNSTDNTKEITKKYTKLVFNKGPERSSQRNFGAKKSKGQYLLFIDSDMILTPKVVEECVEKINKDSKAIIIPEVSIGEGFWTKCKALEKQCYIGDDDIEAARFFERKIFFNFNGYDESIAGGGEDWDLPARIKEKGDKISRVNALIKHNEGIFSLINSMKKKYYYAKTIDKYIQKHPTLAKKQLTIFRPAFFKNWRLLLKNPIYTVGLIIMKGSEFGAGGLGMIRK